MKKREKKEKGKDLGFWCLDLLVAYLNLILQICILCSEYKQSLFSQNGSFVCYGVESKPKNFNSMIASKFGFF